MNLLFLSGHDEFIHDNSNNNNNHNDNSTQQFSFASFFPARSVIAGTSSALCFTDWNWNASHLLVRQKMQLGEWQWFRGNKACSGFHLSTGVVAFQCVSLNSPTSVCNGWRPNSKISNKLFVKNIVRELWLKKKKKTSSTLYCSLHQH